MDKLMNPLVERADGQTEKNEGMVNQEVIVRGQTVVVIGLDDKLR
jgi:small nuclear ribonucleoprotein (snRNP)-like protein